MGFDGSQWGTCRRCGRCGCRAGGGRDDRGGKWLARRRLFAALDVGRTGAKRLRFVDTLLPCRRPGQSRAAAPNGGDRRRRRPTGAALLQRQLVGRSRSTLEPGRCSRGASARHERLTPCRRIDATHSPRIAKRPCSPVHFLFVASCRAGRGCLLGPTERFPLSAAVAYVALRMRR